MIKWRRSDTTNSLTALSANHLNTETHTGYIIIPNKAQLMRGLDPSMPHF